MSSILSRSTFPKTGESPFAPQNGGAKPIARQIRRTKSPRPEAQGGKGAVPMEIRYAKIRRKGVGEPGQAYQSPHTGRNPRVDTKAAPG